MELFDIEKDIERFINSESRVAVNCATLEDAKKFFKILNEHDVKWCNGEELHNTLWNPYDKETCYVLGFKGLEYGRIDYLKNYENYKIVRYKSNLQNNSSNEKYETIEQNMKLFLANKAVVNCVTEEEAEKFLKFLNDEYGIIWRDGSSLINNKYWIYRMETCYRCDKNELAFGDIEYYEKENCAILPLHFLIKTSSNNTLNNISQNSNVENKIQSNVKQSKSRKIIIIEGE